MNEDLAVYGGASAPGEWNFGWIPPDKRTPEQVAAHVNAVSMMPKFAIRNNNYRDTEKAFLWDIAKKANNGQHFPAFYQKTGSCVGNGGGNAVWYVAAVEVIRNKESERVTMPFWLIPYGKSRELAGMRGPGEGSLGSSFARAIREYGIVAADADGLPRWSNEGGITWGESEERRWSDGAAIPRDWIEKSRQHLIQTTAECKSASQIAEAIKNGYPVTIASGWGGQMKPRVINGVLLNGRSGVWQHQMCVIGHWHHPELGEIFYIINSWGVDAHGTCPSGAPPGGFWVRSTDMDWIARNGECYAFSQFLGFPPQELSWYF